MDIALSAVRLLLTVVFGIAAVAKLVDRASFRRALRDFGAPQGLVRPLRYAVPAAELAVAVALVLPVAAWWGAIAAAGMLLAFIAVIGWSLAHGRTPECNCFGRLSAGAIGRKTLVRNGILAALAGALVVAGPARSAASAVGWLGPLTPIRVAGLAGAVAVLALLSFEGWLLVNLVRQNSRLLTRVSALEAALETGAGHRTQLPLVPPSGQANGHRHHHGGERGLPRTATRSTWPTSAVRQWSCCSGVPTAASASGCCPTSRRGKRNDPQTGRGSSSSPPVRPGARTGQPGRRRRCSSVRTAPSPRRSRPVDRPS